MDCTTRSRGLTRATSLTTKPESARSVRCALGGLVRVELERQCRDPGGDVQPVLSFNRNRLQCDGVVEATDQHVGASPYPHCRTGGSSGIGTGQCALTQVGRGCQHRPDHDSRRQIADVGAELADGTFVIFGVAGLHRIGARHVTRRTEDEPPSRRYVTSQVPGAHCRLLAPSPAFLLSSHLRRGQSAERQSQRKDNNYLPTRNLHSSSLVWSHPPDPWCALATGGITKKFVLRPLVPAKMCPARLPER